MSERTTIGGTVYEAIGSSSSNLLLKCNGTARIQWGGKLIDLIKNGKIASGDSQELIFIITDESEIKSDGIYLLTTQESNKLWISKDGNKSFIQIITDDKSYYVNYDIDDFKYSDNPFYIKIGDNYFSRERIHIEINDSNKDIVMYRDIEYSNPINIHNSLISSSIMGPFSYMPFMECNHSVISMKCNVNGIICINDREIIFDDGDGYI